jgi:ATP-dependent DNA helicase DinG
MSLKNDLLKYKPRIEQKNALSFIQDEHNKNKLTKFFLLNLPVGIGKSHLAIMISNWYRKEINKTSKIDIITNNKLLQDQYADSYTSISDLKGKENYECQHYSCSCAQGAEFARLSGVKCDECPYVKARESYITGYISLTNFYLYLLYSVYNPKILENRDSRLLIVDECHEFDDVMSDFISIKITETIIKKFKFSTENSIIKELKSISSISQYVYFLKSLIPDIVHKRNELEGSLLKSSRTKKSVKRDVRLGKLLGYKNKDMKTMQLVTDLIQLQGKIEIFVKEYTSNTDNWVLETTYNEKTKQKELSLEPIWAYDYLDKYVFSKYDMVVLMSGTILDKNLFCQLNGLDVNKAVYYSIESPFPIKNRPIYYLPVGKMSFKSKEETFKKYIPYIKKILKKYENKKGIIHTNSFELSNWIKTNVEDNRLIFHDSSNKDEMLRLHKTSKKPTVIVSPSMDMGVSFDDDDARFQIIAKIPYPSLASQKNKLRQRNNQQWYSWKTVCGIIQASGRPIRSMVDYADTIIIDASFSDILKYNSHFLPDWYQESIKKINIK